ncbi:keratin, type I cytoskeletal 9 [Brachypodium distachyon]|uniref:Hyaluronan/mRNA-binding protein domain-containing protein n=1 Tax=Brachypodium distachyon TaxID=15368 RepID=A0A0Q3N614_BRADI|nr:keratin, type I cytoskeletal 9 [Brachypodium distachyon]KQK12150.1 hypothetical protein BRADI_1g01860v3 [Brachypodium distachyon]|eukprot:XP_010234622.1 keratin, type I cytoskeletal 9 [Brachypodium distachyon]
MGSYFDLLDLAEGASGEEAVAKVVGKVVGKVVPPSEPKPPKKKPGLKGAQPQPQQDGMEEYSGDHGGNYDNNADHGGNYHGNGDRGGYYNGNGDRGGYYNGDGGRGGYSNGNGGRGGYRNGNGGRGGYRNGNSGRGYHNGNGGRGYNNVGYNENNSHYQQGAYGGEYYGYGDMQAQGGNYHHSGERQWYSRDGGQARKNRNLQYKPKSKAASVASSDPDLKPEEQAEPAVETKQQDASADNADGVPAPESEKSSGDVAKDDSKKEGEGGTKKKDGVKTKSMCGSARKRQVNKKKAMEANADGSKKTIGNEEEVNQEEKKEMTLEEYEKMLKEKKSLEPAKLEGREINPVAFEGLLKLEKKLEDDADGEHKEKEVVVKNVKPRKSMTIQEYLKPADGQEYVPPRPPRRDGPFNSSYRGGRGNGGFSDRSRDNSTESRVYNSGRGDNAIVFHNVDATSGNAAPRSGGRPDHNNGRGNGGYQERQGGYNGGYQERQGGYQQGGYNGSRGRGGYRQGGNSEGYGNGGYQHGGGGRGYGGCGRGRGYPQPRPVPRPDSAAHFPALTGSSPKP